MGVSPWRFIDIFRKDKIVFFIKANGGCIAQNTFCLGISFFVSQQYWFADIGARYTRSFVDKVACPYPARSANFQDIFPREVFQERLYHYLVCARLHATIQIVMPR